MPFISVSLKCLQEVYSLCGSCRMRKPGIFRVSTLKRLQLRDARAPKADGFRQA